MFIIFPVIFIASFYYALKEIYNGNTSGVLIFMIFGLSIYTTAMSVIYLYGFDFIIPALQSFKELMILGVLLLNLLALRHLPRFHVIDYLILTLLLYLVVYAVLPIGGQSFFGRLSSLKSIAFYIVVYFAGRLFDPKKVYINKYFSLFIVLAIATAIVLVIEVILQTPLQFHTGYFDYAYHYFNLDADGPYGIAVTFHSDSGYTRFASFYTNPLEHAAAAILAMSIILGLFTDDDNKLRITSLGIAGLCATAISIIFALSRAPLVSYCIVIYIYALITKRKLLVNTIHICFAIVAAYIIYLFAQFENNQTGIIAVLMNTIDFSDPSSVGHLIQWTQGILSISQHPLGLGLGTSGRVAASLDESVGGENQFIIIGVQAGLIAVIIDLAIFFMFIRISYKWLNRLKGKERKLCIAVFLIKVGFFIPTLSSELESSTYLSYMNWFLSGLLIAVIMQIQPPKQLPAYGHREIN
ncbi:O-antigen ligase family protein [Mucilaginibacter ximonensis]|uniref:O-antigen ligase family protein n=1 Tax=Mucilaginibacter ximonensis TaxID=538021 RepID=A0ABW5YEZ7_9SPHI